MNKTVKHAFTAIVSFAAFCATAFEYNVTRPAIRPRWSGAEVGEWTMDRETAFTKAKADLAYTIVLFTGSWWCPICQTCEAKVLTSQAWADYVAKVGYYLVECDYPYRFPVPEGQELAFTASKIPSMLKRLQMNGIQVRTDYEDPCTDRRALIFEGPDRVKISIYEEI